MSAVNWMETWVVQDTLLCQYVNIIMHSCRVEQSNTDVRVVGIDCRHGIVIDASIISVINTIENREIGYLQTSYRIRMQ